MPQATPFDAILVESRDLFRDRLCEAVARMFDGADEALTAIADKATEDEAKKRYLDARDLAVANREVIESQFKQRVMSEFQKRANKVKKIGQSLSDFSLDDLALVGEDDLEETLKFNDMAAKLRRYCEEELGALDQRVGVLLGDASLESEDNPFGPPVICDAYKNACQKVECPTDIRLVFLKLFDDGVLDTIRGTYKSVNELLVENSILPKIRYGIAKSESKGPAAPGLPEIMEAKAKAAAEESGGAAAAAPGDMFAQLAKIMAPGGGAGGGPGGAPAPGMGVGGVPLVQGAQLMGSLTQLQMGNLAALGEAAAELGPILAEAGNLKNVLHQLKGTSVGAGMSQVDAMTLDIVAMLFDQIFDDPKVPIALKGLIGHLQLPMLKVAIADKELFSSKEHPARQLLDTLGRIGLRLPPDFGPENPLFARLETFVRELVDGFQEKMEIFDKVRAELEGIIAEEDARVASTMKDSEKELAQGERLALAKVSAEDEIRKRVGGAAHLPRPIVRFLALQWIKYLVVVGARDGKESDGWKSAVETMDQLLGSITPKATLEERRGVARIIPGLLKRLKTGVSEAAIEDAVSSAFFSELMKCHTEVMHTAAPPKPAGEQPVGTAKEIAKNAKVAVREAAARDASASAIKDPRAATASTLKDPRAATASTLKDPRAATASTLKDPRTPPKPAEPVDDSLDFSAPVEVVNPFGSGKIAVSSEDLDFTEHEAAAAAAAAAAPAPAAAAAPAHAPAPAPAGAPAQAKAPKVKRDTIRLPSAMVVGAWVEILDADGETRSPAKLHYVSPMKSHFLFVDRQGKKVFECSRSMLARRLKLGEVGLLDGEPDESLFDRIMEGIFGKLKAGAPA